MAWRVTTASVARRRHVASTQVGKTVFVDRIDFVGTKVTAKVVDRWCTRTRSHRFTIMFADGQRRFKVPRDELIVQEHKYFLLELSHGADVLAEPPDENRKVAWRHVPRSQGAPEAPPRPSSNDWRSWRRSGAIGWARGRMFPIWS